MGEFYKFYLGKFHVKYETNKYILDTILKLWEGHSGFGYHIPILSAGEENIFISN